MDWDIYPTPLDECVTVQPDPASVNFLVAANNNGFASSDPYSSINIGLGGLTNSPFTFTDLGPRDHGAAFDFQFGPLGDGETLTFNTYYGAAGDQAEAEGALAAIGAEAYSFGKPSKGGVCTGKSKVISECSRCL